MEKHSVEKFSHKPHLPFKSLAGAILFACILGPVGLLYASAIGGSIMIVLAFIVASCQLYNALGMVWLGSCIWAAFATNRYNNKISSA